MYTIQEVKLREFWIQSSQAKYVNNWKRPWDRIAVLWIRSALEMLIRNRIQEGKNDQQK